jgi:hypothetical protein
MVEVILTYNQEGKTLFRFILFYYFVVGKSRSTLMYFSAALNHFSAVHCGLIEYNTIQATESNRDKRRTTERSVFLCGLQSFLCGPLWAD